MRKLILLVSVLGLLVLAGCGGSGKTADQKRIVVIPKSSEIEFWQIVADGARTAGETLGAEVTIQSAVSESQTDMQIAVLENAISTRPDAIVISPTQSSALVPSIEDASNMGIPVIIIDSGADTEKYVAFLGSDNIKVGAMAADEMAAALRVKFGKPAGRIAGITFHSGAASLEERKKGFVDRIKTEYPDIEIVDFRDAMGKTGASLGIVENFLTAHTDLKGLFANAGPNGDETVRALDQAGRKDMAVVLVDAGEQEVWGLENGYVDAIIVQRPWEMGYMGVEYALKAIRGETISRFVDTGVVSVRPAMLKNGEAEQYLNPIAYHKKLR